ncbi:MAG: ATP-binding protein, partial [Natronosporangium sp.]
FVVHAPRQTGKTTTLAALARVLRDEGEYVAVRFSCETGEPVGDDFAAVEQQLLYSIRVAAEPRDLGGALLPPDPWPEAPPGLRLHAGLKAWAEHCPRPLVLFFDEIDALQGESLRSVLRQLRDGYTARPEPFPHSVILCGLRDVRDYKAAAGGDPNRLGTSSPFNIKVASLRIADFTEDQVAALYRQHTADTGQRFTDEGVARAYSYTQGQPWLVNALARDVTEQVAAPAPITADHLDDAKERLIMSRATHLDSLVSKLYEPRVRRVMGPLLAGTLPETDGTFNDDVAYLRDLGLVSIGSPLTVANPIYREIIVRVLGDVIEAAIQSDPRSFVLPDGRLDFRRLLAEFAEFWCQHGDVLGVRAHYHEAAPQLVLMGFLHRIVNGGGYIDREYGVGRGRIDLVVRWPYQDPSGKRAWQREAVELKVWRAGRPDPLPEGLRQLDDYLQRLGLNHGTLVVFDRRDPAAPLADQVRFGEDRTPTGRAVTLLRA